VKWSKTRDEKLIAELTRQMRLCSVKNLDWDAKKIVS